MLLAIPSSTPLAKALSGLQFLLSRIWILQENDSKFSLFNQLEPIILLTYSWKILCLILGLPCLMNEAQDQYEINGGKLWFPLYSVLRHRQSVDITAYDHSVGAFASPSQKDGNFRPAVLIDGDCEWLLMWPTEWISSTRTILVLYIEIWSLQISFLRETGLLRLVILGCYVWSIILFCLRSLFHWSVSL